MVPRVRTAVVLCTHNGHAHVRELLQSIAAQTQEVDELHVFDWNSSDTTPRVIEDALRELGVQADGLHRMDTAPGPAASFIAAMLHVARHSHADLLLLADQDDVWVPTKVSVLVSTYQAEPFDLAHSDVRVVYESSGRIDPSFYGCGGPFVRARHEPPCTVLLTNPAVGMSMAVRRTWLEQIREPLGGHYWVMHDWALMILCWMQSGRLRYVEQPLVDYRQHESNLLGASKRTPLAGKFRSRRSHVANVKRQLDSAAASARNAGCSDAVQRTVLRMRGRLASAATLARAKVLTPKYRLLLGLSFLIG
jgi:glycosyltransferase involved in cell wall biosynthesis